MIQKFKYPINLQNIIIKLISIFVITFIIISSNNIIVSAQTTPTLVIDQAKIKPLLTIEYAQKANDRINVVFFFKDNNISITNITGEISHAIGLDGVVSDPTRNYASDIGLFEIEPFKSNKDKFNFWYYDSYITEIQSKELNSMVYESLEIATFGMDNVAPIYAREEETPGEGSLGVFASVQFEQNDPRRKIITYSPGRMYLRYKKDTLTDGAGKVTKLDKIGLKNLATVGGLLVHEFGHSLFGLSDEYVSSFGTSYDNPNCAHSVEIAKEWWADLEGQTEDLTYLEPFFEGYLKNKYTFQDGNYYSTVKGVKTLIDVNAERKIMIDTFKVGYEKGRCFGIENADVIRPTLNSIMGGGTFPYSYGPVNTRLVNKILNSFSGTEVKTSPSSKNKWIYDTNIIFDADKMEAQTDICVLDKSTNVFNCTWKFLTPQKPEYMSNIKLVDTLDPSGYKSLDTGDCKLTGLLLNCSISFDKLPNKNLYRYNLALVGPLTPNQIPITIFLDKNTTYLTDQRLRYLNFDTMLVKETALDTTPPIAPTCISSTSSPLVITCTGVEPGATVTIPGTTCIPTPADATGIIKCTETVPGALPKDPTVTVKDQAGNQITAIVPYAPIIKDTTPPIAPACTATPNPSYGTIAVTITCTGVEQNATILITGTTCLASTADISGKVICNETIAGILNSNPTVLTKDQAGNSTSTTVNYTKTSAPINTLTCESLSNTSDFDLDGIIDKDEVLAPNLGDANNDGKCDYNQSNVVTVKNQLGNLITIEVVSNNLEEIIPQIKEAKIIAETDNQKQDLNYDYPLGFVSFKVKNSNSVKVNMLLHDNKEINTNQLFRKYNNLIPGNDTTLDYFNFPVTVSTRTINGKLTPTISYTLTDGELGDKSSKDGEIIDPIGLATPVAIITDNNPKPNPSTTPQVIVNPKPTLPTSISNSISSNTASLVRTGASQDALMNSIFIFLILLIIKFKTTTLI
jgi:hypothetical protein